MKWKIGVAAAAALLALTGIAQGAGVFDGSGGSNAEARERAIQKVFKDRDAAAAAGALARRGPRGKRGPKGPRGPAGPAGPKGTFGSVTSVLSPSVSLCGWESGACSVGSATATCPPGTTVVGGGYAGAGIRAFISASVPGGWFVGAANESVFSTTFKAEVLCAS